MDFFWGLGSIPHSWRWKYRNEYRERKTNANKSETNANKLLHKWGWSPSVSLSNRVPQSNEKQTDLFPRKKLRWPSSLCPECPVVCREATYPTSKVKSVDRDCQFLAPTDRHWGSWCHLGGLQGKFLEQMVLAAVSDLPKESPTRTDWPRAAAPGWLTILLLSSRWCYSPNNMPVSQETRSWGKESDFIWKAEKMADYVLKRHLNLGLLSNFFYIREEDSKGAWSQEVTVDRHECQQGSEEGEKLLSLVSWLQSFPWCGSGHDVPLSAWQSSHHFRTYFFISLREASFR